MTVVGRLDKKPVAAFFPRTDVGELIVTQLGEELASGGDFSERQRMTTAGDTLRHFDIELAFFGGDTANIADEVAVAICYLDLPAVECGEVAWVQKNTLVESGNSGFLFRPWQSCCLNESFDIGN